MWRRQEHIFPRGYLGVVSLGKACSWGGVGGRKWHLSCPTMYLVLGSGTHSNCLSASSSTAGGISASGSSGVGSVGRPIRDMSRARKLRVDTVPIQRLGRQRLIWGVVERWGEPRLSISLGCWRLPSYSRPGSWGNPLALGSSWPCSAGGLFLLPRSRAAQPSASGAATIQRWQPLCNKGGACTLLRLVIMLRACSMEMQGLSDKARSCYCC